MDWQRYRERYDDFRRSMGQIEYLSRLELQSEMAQKIVENFSELPGDGYLVRQMMELWGELPLDLDPDDFLKPVLLTPPGEEAGPIEEGYRKAEAPPTFDFYRLLCSQRLVMIFAYLEAFMEDSLRAAFQVCPKGLLERVLPDEMKKRKESWGTILSSGWDKLLNCMFEEYVDDFNRVQFQRRRCRMEKGLKIDFPDIVIDSPDYGYKMTLDRALKLLEDARQKRHLIVHNNGRVDQKYLDKTRKSNLKIGEPVPIEAREVSEVFLAAIGLAHEIFRGVSKEFFGENIRRVEK